jgi:putative toxin-antitoxin system antitoxin component (TIGR02293 family)
MSATTVFLPGFDDTRAAPKKVIDLVAKGLPFDVLDRVSRAYGLTQRTMAQLLGIVPRTLQRRRAAGSLDAWESERLYRYIRLYRLAITVFDDDPDSARQFLTEAQPSLGGEVPIEMARSEYGASEVMDILGRIDHGVYT